jgi:hypothetical protein
MNIFHARCCFHRKQRRVLMWTHKIAQTVCTLSILLTGLMSNHQWKDTEWLTVPFINKIHRTESFLRNSVTQLVKKFPAFYRTQKSFILILILSSHLHLGLPGGFFRPGLPTNILYSYLVSPMRTTCPSFPSHPLYLITLIIFDEEHKWWNSSLWSFLHLPVIFILLRPKYSPQHPFLNSFTLYKKVKVKLSLCFFNWAPRHEGVLGEWSYSFTHSLTCTLDGGEWSALRHSRFTLRERAPRTHWIGSWVGTRTVLDAVLQRKIPSSAGNRIEPRSSSPQPSAIPTELSRLFFHSIYFPCSEKRNFTPIKVVVTVNL